MNPTKRMYSALAMCLLASVMFIGGCAKKPAPQPTAPPPPPPPAPTASISASPNSIERGQSAQLTWRTDNATDVTISGLGSVSPNGSQMVSPNESTSYRLVARGAGGSQDATARVTVNAPAPPPPAPAPITLSDEQWFAQNIRDAYFDYDSSAIRPDAQQAINATAQALAQKPTFRLMIEGHCDERGSTEYNLTLGDERARAVRDALVAAGISASRITTTSFGKEKPFCTESSESCWQTNRRGHLVLAGK